jgi:hypothetical protein
MVKGSIEWEHNPGEGLVLRIKSPFGGMDAAETRKHALAARKEILLALRSLIDVAVKHLEEKEQKTENTRTKIKVE